MEPSEGVKFIVRRAFRAGRVVRGDVRTAMGVGDAQASRLLSEAAASVAGLRREPRWVCLEPWAQPPRWASAMQLMEALERSDSSFREIGLHERELPVNYVHWTARAPRAQDCMQALVQGIVHGRRFVIHYAGLRLGEAGRWRRVYPLGLERMGDQWRLIAHDLEHAEFAIRTFVLARIGDAVVDPAKLPKKFTPATAHDQVVRYQVTLDDRYTKDQRQAFEHELGISDDVIHLPLRSEFEFMRRFGDVPASSDAVWPPVTRLKRLE